LVLLGLAVYVGVSDDAIQGSTLGRVAVVTILVVLALLVGEVARIRGHVAAILQILRQGLEAQSPRDDRAAVDVLVRALESSDADVRAKAHKNLLRITGQGFPADAEAWKKWWSVARETFPKRREAGAS
jgi:hypothetical protein